MNRVYITYKNRTHYRDIPDDQKWLLDSYKKKMTKPLNIRIEIVKLDGKEEKTSGKK